MRRAYTTAATLSPSSSPLPPPLRPQPLASSHPFASSPPTRSRSPPSPPPSPPSHPFIRFPQSLSTFATANADLEATGPPRAVDSGSNSSKRAEGSREAVVSSAGPSPPSPLRVELAFAPPPSSSAPSSRHATGKKRSTLIPPHQRPSSLGPHRLDPPPPFQSRLPPFLLPFLPPPQPDRPKTAPPSIAYLPPPPPIFQVKLLSQLCALLPHSEWKDHLQISRLYHQLDSELLTPRIHRVVASILGRAPRSPVTLERFSKAVERMKRDGVKPPLRIQRRLLAQSHGVRAPGPDGENQRPDKSELEAWNLLYGDVAPYEEPAPSVWNRRLSITRRLTPSLSTVNEILRSPNLTSISFQSILACSPAPHRHIGPLVALQSRLYSTPIIVSNLPALLQDPRAEINTEALNQVMHMFAMDDKLDITVAMEAYAAFRRHAAGYHWRRVYIERAAQGLYQNYDDPTVSFANPILDSLGYNFPPDLKPNRQTYTLFLRACIVKGNLNLALVVFKDMLNPNGMSLRIPGSMPGPAHAPPTLLETFLPGLGDYTSLFVGFHTHGKTEGLDPDQMMVYDEERGVLMPPQEGGGKEDSASRLWRQNVRNETTAVWETSMAFEETAPLQDPYLPDYTGELTGRKQWAVNVATEHKKWSLKTLVIVFRSFLNLLPSGEITAPNPLPTYLPPAPPRFLPSSSLAPHSRRVYWILRAFAVTSNYNPHVVRSAYDVLEAKFGPGNEEGWVGWRVGEETVKLMRAIGRGEGIRVGKLNEQEGGGFFAKPEAREG